MRNTRYNAFIIVIPGFSENESDIGNDIPSISGDILGIAYQIRNTDILGLSKICDSRLPYTFLYKFHVL